MAAPARIFLSYDTTDATVAKGLRKHLNAAFAGQQLIVCDRHDLYPGADTVRGGEAWLAWADLCIVLFSADYLSETTSQEFETAKRLEQERRPALQILIALSRTAALPADFQPFPLAPHPDEPVVDPRFDPDRQLQRVAAKARALLTNVPLAGTLSPAVIHLPLAIDDAKGRLLAQTDRLNPAPLLSVLKKIIANLSVKRVVLDIEEKFSHYYEMTRLSKISIPELERGTNDLRIDLEYLLENLTEENLQPDWRDLFIRNYFHFTHTRREQSSPPPFFIPADEIIIPETLNLPLGTQDQDLQEQVGLLSVEQKNDFRRSLLLCKDALVVGNFAAAYTYADHVRVRIDPRSAQLYEYLLVTFIQLETPLRIMQDAVMGSERRMKHIALFASRLQEYNNDSGKCPTASDDYNRAIVAEALSDAALSMYHALPNDYVRDTGKHAETAPNNRQNLRSILANMLTVCRVVHPSEELLEAAVNECCGGGKYCWIRRVDVVDDHFVFTPDGNFDLEGEIAELRYLLQQIEADEAGKIVKDAAILREDLYFSLLAKRQVLRQQLLDDARLQRPYTDTRLSIIRFVAACLLGNKVFGDTDERGKGHSFFRLALEYLMPELLTTEPDADLPEQRWLTLNMLGKVITHPDAKPYNFDAQAVIEKIIRDYAGQAGWLQVAPNLKESVFLQYLADTERDYATVRTGLAFTDIRRPQDLEARRTIISCMRRWVVCYHAYPETGQPYLDKCVREITGDGLLHNWLYFNPMTLITHPDSQSLGYDARLELAKITSLTPAYSEDELKRLIVENLFEQRIVPAYEKIKRGDETGRKEVVQLLLQTLSGYKMYPKLRYLDFVFQELTEEVKFRWLDISAISTAVNGAYATGCSFDAKTTLEEINKIHPDRYRLMEMRERLATRRHADQIERYFLEISEFRRENRRPERQIAIEIIRAVKAIFRYWPKEEFLKLAYDEVSGKGRIRWNAQFLGLFATRENHYENSYFTFNYRFELFEVKRLLATHYDEMQRVLRETGDI